MTRTISVNAAYEALARFVVRFRWVIVVFWLAAAVVTTALPSIGSQVNDNNSAFLKSSEPSIHAANVAAPVLGGGVNGNVTQIPLVAVSDSGRLNAADVASITHLVSLLKGVEEVASVQVAGVSPDVRAVQLRLRAHISVSATPDKDKALVEALQAQFPKAKPPAGLHFYVTGQLATIVANQKQSDKQGGEVQLISFVFIIVLLLIVFRSLPAALITLLPAGLALAISGRLIGALGEGGLKVSSITQILLIVLLLGAGTDYGLFYVFRVREELRAGHDAHQAVERALVRVGESITGSAGTVIIALLTLLFASFGLYHDLGVPLAVGMAVMLLLGLTLLPALLAILGRKAFWPAKVRSGEQKDGIWGKAASTLVQRPKLTLVVGVLVFLALAVGALGYKAGGFGGATNPPKGTPAAAANKALLEHFPHNASNPANVVYTYTSSVWQNPAPIARAQSSLQASGQFEQLAGPLSPTGTALTAAQLEALYAKLGPPQRLPVRQPASAKVAPAQYNAYRADALFVSKNGKVIQFEAALTAGPQDSTAAMNATPAIRTVVSRAGHASGARFSGLAGEAAAIYDINHTANHDLAVVIPIAIVAIGLLLAAVLRSAVAPLYLIVSVALSYVASLGLATIVFIDLGGDGGISFILPFLMFIFLLALGEDYNILVMTRIREEARTLPLREAVVRAISRTGSTVTSAGIILGGTFAVFGIVGGSGAGNGQLHAIGFGLAAGILMDTFLVRTLLVPSVVVLLGRWNWWPSHLAGDEHHERIHGSAAEEARA
ncbi:MAG: MMPL family transporter [Solirubrobacteraceae bacterium]